MLKGRKGNFNFIYKGIFTIILISSLLLFPIISFAQDMGIPGECGVVGADPTDPYNPCPLDTWVWVLAVIAVIFGAVYMQRAKKLQNQA